MKASDKYQITIEWSDEDEAFIALVPAINGCISHGETREEAASNIEEALEGALEVMEANNIPIPPSDKMLTLLRDLKPLIKITTLAKRAGMKPSTLSSKVDRGGPFTEEEKERLETALRF